MLLVGTADGLLDLALDGSELRRTLPGADVVAVDGDWAIADGWVMALESGAAIALDGLAPRCVTAVDGGRALVGTSHARLVEVGGPDGPQRDAPFDGIPTRTSWTTPWGGPPDTRSVAVGPKGRFAGVHVGGVWRRDTTGWIEVVPAEADDHQVVTAGDRVAVAAAIGVGQSDDGGDTWVWSHDGLQEGAVYRRPVGDPQAPFVRCGSGDEGDLPASFPHNVDTFSLAAAGPLVAVGTPTGGIYLSEDSGATWRAVSAPVPGVRCLSFSA
jgi:hypothetical protein